MIIGMCVTYIWNRIMKIIFRFVLVHIDFKSNLMYFGT